MLYLTTIAIYTSVFLFSLIFYSTRMGARALYGGAGALTIDILAILAGAYAIYFSNLSYVKGVGTLWVVPAVAIGSVVSAMHLAKWIVRSRFGVSMR